MVMHHYSCPVPHFQVKISCQKCCLSSYLLGMSWSLHFPQVYCYWHCLLFSSVYTEIWAVASLKGIYLQKNSGRVINMNNDKQLIQKGVMEITAANLICIDGRTKEQWQWPLKFLRKYGRDGDIFSFEAGRKCPGSEGLYFWVKGLWVGLKTKLGFHLCASHSYDYST